MTKPAFHSPSFQPVNASLHLSLKQTIPKAHRLSRSESSFFQRARAVVILTQIRLIKNKSTQALGHHTKNV